MTSPTFSIVPRGPFSLAEAAAFGFGQREALYDLEEPVTTGTFEEIAEKWRPLRTWAVVLIRAAGPRLLDADGARVLAG